jgi:hypothetical protein
MKVNYIKLYVPEQLFYAASDIHFGIKNCDIDAFKKELEEAKERNARIILNGDVFDAIFPRGDPRWNPSLLIPQLVDRDDAPLYAVQLMADILNPCINQIDMIGMGNHEYAVYKYNQINMTDLLVMMLNQRLNGNHKILYGGYTGYLGYGIGDKNHYKALKILYHHGSGGSSPVTKGMIDVNRKEVNWDYDIFLFAHKHNRFAVSNGRIQPVFRKDGGYIYWTDNRAIQTGSFYRNYSASKDEGTKIPPYEEVKEHQPKPIGGVFFNVKLERAYIKGLHTDSPVFKIRAEV